MCAAFVLLFLTLGFIGCGGSTNSSKGSNPSNPSNPGSPGQPGSNPGGGNSSPEFLFASTLTNSQVFGFAIDPATGKLSAVQGSPFSDSTVSPRVCSTVCNRNPVFLTGDPGGKYLYALDGNSGALSQYKVDNSGRLTLNSKVSQGFEEGAAHPSGSFVYYSHFGDLFGYQANPVLTPTPGSPQRTGEGAQVGEQNVAVSTNFVYLSTVQTADVNIGSSRTTIHAFRIDSSTGGLTPASNQIVPEAQDERSTGSIFMTPNGRFLYYVNSRNGNVFVYQADSSTGALTLVSHQVLPDIVKFLISPGSTTAYTSEFRQHAFTTYRIDPNTGALTPINSQIFPLQQEFVIDPAGRFAYSVTGIQGTQGGNNITVYQIDSNGIFHQTDTTTVSVNDSFGYLAITQIK